MRRQMLIPTANQYGLSQVRFRVLFLSVALACFGSWVVPSLAFAESSTCEFPRRAANGLTPISKCLDEWKQKNSVASENAKLVKTARWDFGAHQIGFEIYIPLIQKTIGTKANYDTDEFANALMAWQKKNNASPCNGLLDLNAFNALKKYWQESRGIEHAFEEKERVNISEDYRYLKPNIPVKPESLWLAGKKTFHAYQAMFAAARKDGVTGDFLKIASSNRDLKRLKMLQQGVPKNKIGFSIAGTKSVHFTGRALDLYVGGDPTESNDPNRLLQIHSKAYLWLLENGDKFGFKNYFYEPWHWEYVGGEVGAEASAQK
jgi:D-alanyl-D-alanine carboxypeptidase